MKPFIFFAFCVLIPCMALGQDSSTTKPLDALTAVIQHQSVTLTPLGVIPAPDSISREQQAQLQQAYTNLRLFTYDHIRRTYQWNYISTLIIFWVVILLVISGLVFSGVQFYKSIIATQRGKEAQAPEASTIEASLQGIKITSSVLGVIILVISMLFFYLYLAHVYPVITVPK